MSKVLKVVALLSFSLVYAVLIGVKPGYADILQSSHYQIEESIIGTDDINKSNSTTYNSTGATGSLVVGNTASGNFQVDTGSVTTKDPNLSVIINSGNVSFGNFSATAPTVTTSSFSVLNYTSYGYIVQLVGSTPTNGSRVIPPMTTTGPSIVGNEQFGINLVANTLPVSVGTNPNNGQFGFGTVNANYSTPNQYRYNSGETIASAPKSSGVTTYTISYLVNVAGLTPGGVYSGNQTLIVTGRY
jgi:hypothetical protein